MGSSSKKDKKDKKRKHDQAEDDYAPHKDKKHKKKHKHHKEKKKDRKAKEVAEDSFSFSSDSDVIVVPITETVSDKYSARREEPEPVHDRADDISDYAYDALEQTVDRVYGKEKPEKVERVYERDDHVEKSYERYDRPDTYYDRQARPDKEKSDKYYEREARPEKDRSDKTYYEKDGRSEKERSEKYYDRESRPEKYYEREKERPDKYYDKETRTEKYYEKESRPERSSYDYERRDERVERSYDKYERSEPVQSSGSADSLSIEETNKLRAKLGLKPLDVGGSSSYSSAPKSSSRDSRDGKGPEQDLKKINDDLGEFYHKPAENAAQKLQAEKLREKFKQNKEKRMLQSKLAKVKPLGESDEEDDISGWVNKSRKIEIAKKEAEKRAKMLEELDAQFGIGDIVESEEREKRRDRYSQKDIVGMKVNHDVNSFAEERDTILTLKDKGVLDEDDEDILMNINMLENEKYKKNVEVKKKKILYNAYEDQDFDEFGNPKERSLLSKYDEEIDGEKRESFRIGFDNAVEKKKVAERTIKEKLAKKNLETIAEKNLIPMSEYYNEDEMAKFKKPKKKNRRLRTKGKLTAEEILMPQNTGIESIGFRRNKIKTAPDEPEMSIDDIPDVKVPANLKFEDDKDDLLEQALHKTRIVKQKTDLIADIIKSEVKEEPAEETDTSNIVLNSTAEFCRTLGDIPTYGKAGNREEDEDEFLDFEKTLQDDMKDSDDECEIIEPSGWNSVDPSRDRGDHSKSGPQEIPILEEEPDVSTGMGAALKLAMSKGYLDKEEKNRPSNSRLAYLQAQHYSIEDKNYGEEGQERGGRGRDRYSGPIQDFREKDGWKPNVKLEYIDDEGHLLNSKEAFRYLSHKFHGKGPGKNKVEKRLKKSTQETLMMKMSSTDTPLGTLNMLQAKQKETQSPFVVLSGNKQQQSTVIAKTRR